MTAPIRSMPELVKRLDQFRGRLFVILNFGKKEEAIDRICFVVEEVVKESIRIERARARKAHNRRLKRNQKR